MPQRLNSPQINTMLTKHDWIMWFTGAGVGLAISGARADRTYTRLD